MREKDPQRRIEAYADIGMYSAGVIAIGASVMVAFMWLSTRTVASHKMAFLSIAVLAVASALVSVGFRHRLTIAAVVALVGALLGSVFFFVHPIHAGAAKGLGILLAGPAIAGYGMLKHRYARI
jgi:hypothetical protein